MGKIALKPDYILYNRVDKRYCKLTGAAYDTRRKSREMVLRCSGIKND